MKKIVIKTYGKDINIGGLDDLLKNQKQTLIDCIKKINNKINTISIMRQIHSSNVIDVSGDKEQLNVYENVDGIISNKSMHALCVFHADCVPIMLYDDVNLVVSAVHAGWKGAKLNIIKNAIDKMLLAGARIDKIHAFIGPCIKQKSYQVDVDFYNDFLKKDKSSDDFFIASDNKKYLFDLTGYVIFLLNSAGVKSVCDSMIDTYRSDEFFSHRFLTHNKTTASGRNISVIAIAE